MNSTIILILIIALLIIVCIYMFWPSKSPELNNHLIDQSPENNSIDLSNISDPEFKRSLLEINYTMNKRLGSINKLFKIFIIILFLSILASGFNYLML